MNGRTYRWSGKSENCEWCDAGVKETIEHLMIECKGHDSERKELKDMLRNLIGEKWISVCMREDRGVSVLLGFECEDVELNASRMEIVREVKKFLKRVWSKRA